MRNYCVVLLILSCFVIASGEVYGNRSRLVTSAEGSTIEEETGFCLEGPSVFDFDSSPQIVWHYTSTDWEGTGSGWGYEINSFNGGSLPGYHDCSAQQ